MRIIMVEWGCMVLFVDLQDREDRDQRKYYEGDVTTYCWLSLDVQSKVMNLLGRISPTEVDKWQWNLAHDLIDELTEILLWTDRHKFICPCSRKMPREVRPRSVMWVMCEFCGWNFSSSWCGIYISYLFIFSTLFHSPFLWRCIRWTTWLKNELTDWLTCWWVPDYICCGGT